MVETGATPEPNLHVGPYRVGEPLGEGGIGVVYRGFHERLRRPVALKRLLPDKSGSGTARKRFLREAQAAARLNHPAVVQVYDILEHEGDDWIVMELVEGSSLHVFIDKGPLQWSRALDVGLSVAAALEAAHGVAILHRDLKTQNVMLSDAGEVKVVDFGLAKDLRAEEDESQGPAQVVTVVGTPRAMSPEQAMNLPLDPRSDLFSFGVLLYEMLTARSPFRGSTLFSTLNRVCTFRQASVFEVVPSVPQDLSQLVDDLLEKAPEDRPSDARTVRKRLARIAGAAGNGGGVVMTRRDPHAARAPSTEATPSSDPSRSRSSSSQGSSQASQHLADSRLEELRQIIVVFVQLEAEDQEGLRALLPELQENARSLIHSRRGGCFVETPQDDRLVVCLGYPQAFEDDARSAVIVGRSLLDQIARISLRNSGVGLRASCGLNKGVVLTPADPSSDATPDLGPVLDEAERVGQAAETGKIVFGRPMLPLIHDYFVVEKTELAVEDSDGPEEFYEILSKAEHESTLDATWFSAPLRSVVGRQTETRLLEDTFRAAIGRELQVVQVCAEGGMGKTKLLTGLHTRLESEFSSWVTVSGSPEATNSPFFPISTLLKSFFGVSDDQSVEDQVATIDTRGEDLNPGDENYLPFLASLISRDLENAYPAPSVTPEVRKERIFEALTALVAAAGQDRPMVLAVEDVHWLDPSTLEWITLLIEERPVESLFLVLTFRPHFVPPWGHRADVIQLNLNPLSKEPTREVIRDFAGSTRLPAELVEKIVAKTDGVPLFIEQVTRTVLDSAAELEDGRWPELEIPETLRGSLMARLDRLGPAKSIAQYASVVGREFLLPVLQALVALEDEALRSELKQLTAAGILSRRGIGRQTRFLFKHALIRDAAYESLRKRDRESLHRKIVGVLEDSFPEIGRRSPELLAHHCAQGGLVEQAVAHRLRAASESLDRSANQEAISHCEEGLRLLESLEDADERHQTELDLRGLLVKATTAAKGPAAPELEESFLRIEKLAKQVGDGQRLTHALRGLFDLAHYSGNSARMLDYSGRFLRHAEELEDRLLLMEAHFQSGMTRFFRGDLDAAESHKTEGLVIAGDLHEIVADPEARAVGQSKALLNRSLLALTLWMRGRVDRSRDEIRRMLEEAESVDLLTRSLVVENAAGVLFEMGDTEGARRHARAALELSQEHELFTVALSQAMLDVVDLHSPSQDDEAAGERQETDDHPETSDRPEIKSRLEATLAALLANGARFAMSFFFCRVAEAHVQDEDYEKAKKDLLQAEELIEALDERAWYPELLRIRGELLWATGREDDAVRSLEASIEAAHNQGAASFERRSILALLRRRENDSARRRLSELPA